MSSILISNKIIRLKPLAQCNGPSRADDGAAAHDLLKSGVSDVTLDVGN